MSDQPVDGYLLLLEEILRAGRCAGSEPCPPHDSAWRRQWIQENLPMTCVMMPGLIRELTAEQIAS